MNDRFPLPFRWLAATTLALILVAAPCVADEKTPEKNYKNLAKSLKNADWGISLFYRYAHVDVKTVDPNGRASTLRTAMFYRSGLFHNLRGFFEVEDVSNLGLHDKHNDSQNGVPRPLIPDPPETKVLQVHLGYEGLPDTEIAVGRREINLDNQRFVGAVPWRQNHQSFDALYVTQKSLPRTKITYSYLKNVNTVIVTNKGMKSHVLNVGFDPGLGKIAGYLYWLNYDNLVDFGLSTKTIGASWSGKAKITKKLTMPFRVELANQRDIEDNPGNVNQNYSRFDVGVEWGPWGVAVGHETLGGEVSKGQFYTPLATLHKFNGWADLFVPATPVNGLVDVYVSARYTDRRFAAILIYHDFGADSTGANYGRELDGRLVYTAPWKQAFAVKFADYDANSFGSSTRKYWLYTSYRFGSS
jgi:hypothetical protein